MIGSVSVPGFSPAVRNPTIYTSDSTYSYTFASNPNATYSCELQYGNGVDVSYTPCNGTYVLSGNVPDVVMIALYVQNDDPSADNVYTITVSKPTTTTTVQPTNSPSSSKSSNAGAIAGGVIGAIVGLVIIVLIVVYVMRKRKQGSSSFNTFNDVDQLVDSNL